MTEIHTGSCLCGAVKFRVDGPLREIVFCHCGQCRKQTGLYYASTNAATKDLTVEGEDNITWYQSSDEGRRGFCKHCGSALFWKYRGREHISIHIDPGGLAGEADGTDARLPYLLCRQGRFLRDQRWTAAACQEYAEPGDQHGLAPDY
jgi:hypothetical protein